MLGKIVRNMDLYHNKKSKQNLINKNQFESLRYISKHPGITSIEISNYLNVDKALVTRMVQKLIDLKYVSFNNDEIDKRKKRLYITENGQEIKLEEFNHEETFFNECMSVLSKEEKDNFMILLEKVYLKSKDLRKKGFE